MATEKPVVIVGGGVSGLSVAYLLATHDVPTVLIEKEDRLGGLARSFRYGEFTFDIGPHRFHSERTDIVALIKNILDGHVHTIPRSSSVRFAGAFYPWPLHPSYTLLRFPPRIALSILRDLFVIYHGRSMNTFKDYIINLYGKTLYELFFEGYSAKFLGIVPELTHIDWAKTGIDRSIIDTRLKMHSLWQLMAGALLPSRRPPLQFLYPDGGCDRFITHLEQRYRALGGEVICGASVASIDEDARQTIRAIRTADREIEAAALVWTGDIHSLTDLLGLPRAKLKYLSLVCYNLMLTAGSEFPFQWCYHGAPDILFSRVAVPRNFDQSLTPAGHRSLCVEVTTPDDKGAYQEPEKYLDRVLTDAARENLLFTAQEVIDARAERVLHAYPIYSLDYRQELERLDQALASHTNLFRGGRLGLFWYNNMDQCIEAAYPLVDRILARLP